MPLEVAEKLGFKSKLGTLCKHSAHWGRKARTKSGRAIGDMSDSRHGSPLNSEEAKVKLEALYGPIEHPTIEDLVGMVLSYADDMKKEMGDKFRWEDMVLWKADLRRAFTLLFFRSGDACYLACQLSDGLVMIYHTGMFGWTGTPFAFQVITRVIERICKPKLKGRMKMYVDDGNGVTMRWFLEHDKAIMKDVCETLLGPKAIAENKWEEGVRLTMIGWDLAMDTRLVTISRRNFMKTLYGFFTADLEGELQVCEIEKLASWSSRYAMILRVMKPFSQCLHAETKGMTNQFAFKKFRSFYGKLAVLMWRVMLCLLHLDERTFARPMNSFREERPTHLVEMDSSLTGLGVSISQVEPPEVLGVGNFDFPFDLGMQSKWQNVAEFLSIVMAYIWLARKGVRRAKIKLKGDNLSSLSWGSSEHFGSRLGFRSVLMYIMLAVVFDFRVVETEHIPGVLNSFHDKLSRGVRPGALGVAPTKVLDMEEPQIVEMMRLCDPTRDIESVPDFLGWWDRVRCHIEWLRGCQGA